MMSRARFLPCSCRCTSSCRSRRSARRALSATILFIASGPTSSSTLYDALQIPAKALSSPTYRPSAVKTMGAANETGAVALHSTGEYAFHKAVSYGCIVRTRVLSPIGPDSPPTLWDGMLFS